MKFKIFLQFLHKQNVYEQNIATRGAFIKCIDFTRLIITLLWPTEERSIIILTEYFCTI